jgi:hypothetical protein
MEHIALKGIKRLENNVVLMNNETLKQLVNYIGAQTNAINALITELESVKSENRVLSKLVDTNSTNIKNIAKALEGVYKNA